MALKNIFLLIIVLMFTILSCKENKIDPLLLEADEIQHEAINIGIKADSILDARMAEGANKWNIDSLRMIKSSISKWRNEMIVIPGIGHSHDNHDHGDHGHEGHSHGDHDHGESNVAAQLSPIEIKKVQEEWKAAIILIYDTLN